MSKIITSNAQIIVIGFRQITKANESQEKGSFTYSEHISKLRYAAHIRPFSLEAFISFKISLEFISVDSKILKMDEKNWRQRGVGRVPGTRNVAAEGAFISLRACHCGGWVVLPARSRLPACLTPQLQSSSHQADVTLLCSGVLCCPEGLCEGISSCSLFL